MSTGAMRGFAERHPYITKYLIFFVVSTVASVGKAYIEYMGGSPHYPHLDVEESVVESDRYLAEDEVFAQESLADTYGQHVVFVGKPGEPTEHDGAYWYGPVFSVNMPSRGYLLRSREKLPASSRDRYASIDGILIGRYSSPTGSKSGKVANIYPVLEVCGVRSGDVQDLAAPVVRQDIPHISASEAGITLTLDVVELRTEFAVVTVTIKNETNHYLDAGIVQVTHAGETLGDSSYPSLVALRYFDDFTYSSLEGFLRSGDEHTMVLLLDPCDLEDGAAKPLRVRMEARLYDYDESYERTDLEQHALEVAYDLGEG